MSDLARIRRLSRKMEYFTSILLLATPLLLAFIWLYLDSWIPMLADLTPEAIRLEALTPWTRLLGFLISMIPAAVMMYGLLQMRALFKQYQRGQIFTGQALLRLRKFAWTLLLSSALKPLIGAVLSVLLSLSNPPGQRMLVLTLSSNDIAMLFISGVFIVIAWIMAEGVRLADDNAQIV